MRSIHLLLGLAVLLALAAAGCGGDSTTGGDPGGGILAADTIGADGGVMEVAGEFSLQVPAGAVDDPVTVTVERNVSPGDAPPGQVYASTVYRFGPDGHAFLTPVNLTLDYDPAVVSGAMEDSVRVWFRETGGDWTSLPSLPDPPNDQVTGLVAHFSDFAAMVPEGEDGEGVYCALAVDKGIQYLGTPGATLVSDVLSARFDSEEAPCEPVDPQQVDSVLCNDWRLEWEIAGEMDRYVYRGTPGVPFIETGEDYAFHVYGGVTCPDLEETITFPDDAPYITSPVMMTTAALSGFTVLWEGAGDGTVFLTLQQDADNLTVEVPNSGSHAFSAGDLSAFSAGEATLAMNHYDQRFIAAAGYHPQSFIVAKVTSTTLFTFE